MSHVNVAHDGLTLSALENWNENIDVHRRIWHTVPVGVGACTTCAVSTRVWRTRPAFLLVLGSRKPRCRLTLPRTETKPTDFDVQIKRSESSNFSHYMYGLVADRVVKKANRRPPLQWPNETIWKYNFIGLSPSVEIEFVATHIHTYWDSLEWKSCQIECGFFVRHHCRHCTEFSSHTR